MARLHTAPDGQGSVDPVGSIAVEVVWCDTPRKVQRRSLQLPQGATALQGALAALSVDQLKLDAPNSITFAVWNRKAGPQTVLQNGDRLELLRPLTVDPKIARQRRFDKQGKRGTGLFRIKKQDSFNPLG